MTYKESTLKKKSNSKRKSKTKFEEFLTMEMNKGTVGYKEDLEMERKLAKKLKVKGGKLKRCDDGIDEILEGIPSLLDSMLHDEIPLDDEKATLCDINDDEMVRQDVSSCKKQKRNKTAEDETICDEEGPEPILSREKCKKKKSRKNPKNEIPVREEEIVNADKPDTSNEGEQLLQEPKTELAIKYVAPHLRACANKESEELVQIRRRIRGLLNKLSESNVESITEEVATIFRSLPRRVGCQIINEEVIVSCSRGPRGNEQYAAVFAAFIAGMACLVGIDFGAKLIASVAKSFEDEYSREDGLSLRNLTLLLCYLCIFGVCSSDLIYDLLSTLSKRLTEMDVSTILTILQCCGMKLRGDDPAAMKDFVLSIQNRVNEAKLLSKSEQDGKLKINNKRMEFMLDTICEIKNNKKRPKEDSAHHTRIKKWLQKLTAEGILLRGLKWSKLLDPQKKGQWWHSGEFASTGDTVEEVANTISKEVQETQKLMQLAAAQRMNTDTRRAIFCIIMSGEDYIDTFEKILKLGLSGKQDREIIRVLLACCLQEKVFNKYYTVLASKLCSHDKNHKFTLQYCIWDHYKELDTMELSRSMNLAKFVAEMLSSFSLSLALLKTIDLMDPAQLTPRRIVHFRMLMQAIFDRSDALVWNIFTRVAAAPELETLKSGLLFFIKQYVVEADAVKNVAGKYKIAKKALYNVAGVLM